MQYTCWDVFPTAQFLSPLILIPFSASAIFCFTSSTSAKHFPLRTFFFSSRETKKSHKGQDRANRVKNCWMCSVVWAGAPINHPSWNGQMSWVFKKNSLKLNAASHNTTSWYTDTDWVPRTCTYWGKPVLQGARPPEDNSSFLCVGVSPSYIITVKTSSFKDKF